MLGGQNTRALVCSMANRSEFVMVCQLYMKFRSIPYYCVALKQELWCCRPSGVQTVQSRLCASDGAKEHIQRLVVEQKLDFHSSDALKPSARSDLPCKSPVPSSTAAWTLSLQSFRHSALFAPVLRTRACLGCEGVRPARRAALRRSAEPRTAQLAGACWCTAATRAATPGPASAAAEEARGRQQQARGKQQRCRRASAWRASPT